MTQESINPFIRSLIDFYITLMLMGLYAQIYNYMNCHISHINYTDSIIVMMHILDYLNRL